MKVKHDDTNHELQRSTDAVMSTTAVSFKVTPQLISSDILADKYCAYVAAADCRNSFVPTSAIVKPGGMVMLTWIARSSGSVSTSSATVQVEVAVVVVEDVAVVDVVDVVVDVVDVVDDVVDVIADVVDVVDDVFAPGTYL